MNPSEPTGINRIRLEFKGSSYLTWFRSSRVLIESDWNLKVFNTRDQRPVYLVLIESDWNLKSGMQAFPV